ncbi:MAG: Inositol 2-dehydrogenase [Verrucomicrobia subdivision 3 bacterium]|nr:Inositol 2-dehydrogenase [Limisphaerales bacterium]MCS1417252.1 Inositol 2-dehydrogenase [Limisphaerales bacterium]
MSKVNRRRFIEASVAAGAGIIAMPYIGRVQGANEKLGAAVIGVGGRGNSHLGAFVNDARTEVRVIVEVDEKIGNYRCNEIEEKQGKRPVLVNDMRHAFDSTDVNIMSTATPNHWHALAGIWAMQAGKDAYIEKPISHNIAEGSALVAAAKKYKRMCQVGTQCRSNPAIINAMSFLHDGGIGELKFARGLCYKRRKSIGSIGDYEIPENIDFNTWSGPATYTDPKLTRSRFHYDWHWQRHYGNGDLGNQGPHQTDIARWGLGVDAHPNAIISYGGRLGYQAERNDPHYVDAGDTANTEVSIYDYGDKCMVFETRGLDVTNSDDEEINKLFNQTKGNKIGVIFYGSDGYLVQRSYTHCIVYDKQFKVVKEFKGGGDHFGNFIKACQTRDASKLNSDAWEGHLSAGVSHLGNIAYYLGEQNHVSVDEAKKILSDVKSLDDNLTTLDRTVKHLKKNGVDLNKHPISMGPLLKFDPKREVFPESSAATALLTRTYREGFICPTADRV